MNQIPASLSKINSKLKLCMEKMKYKNREESMGKSVSVLKDKGGTQTPGGGEQGESKVRNHKEKDLLQFKLWKFLQPLQRHSWYLGIVDTGRTKDRRHTVEIVCNVRDGQWQLSS